MIFVTVRTVEEHAVMGEQLGPGDAPCPERNQTSSRALPVGGVGGQKNQVENVGSVVRQLDYL